MLALSTITIIRILTIYCDLTTCLRPRTQRQLLVFNSEEGRKKLKIQSEVKASGMINLDLTPSMQSLEWLIALKVILYTRLHIISRYDASRILRLQINQHDRVNTFDCKFWLALPKIMNVYRNEDSKIQLENNLYHYSVKILYLLETRI